MHFIYLTRPLKKRIVPVGAMVMDTGLAGGFTSVQPPTGAGFVGAG